MDVHRILAGERGAVSVAIVDGATGGNPGIVDEDVEPAELRGDIIDELLDVGGRRLVGLEGAGFDALRLDLVDDGFRLSGEAT